MSLLKPRKPTLPPVEPTINAPVFEDRLLRIADVCGMVGLGKSTIYTLIRDGKFPQQRKRTERASVWLLSEVQAYIKGEFTPPQVATLTNEGRNASILKLVRNSRGVKHG